MAGVIELTVAHAILSPCGLYLVFVYMFGVWVHILGDPQERSAEERYNNNNQHQSGTWW